VFEQIAASFNQFEELATKWHDKWEEAPFEDRRQWSALFNGLVDRIEFYDKLTRLEKRRLEFMSSAVERAVVDLESDLSAPDRTPAEVDAILRGRNPK